jgi:hypothetical protein
MNIHLQTILGFTRLPGDRPYFLTISGGDDLQVRLDIESLDSKRKRDKMGLEPRSRKGRPSERFGPPLGLAQKKLTSRQVWRSPLLVCSIRTVK